MGAGTSSLGGFDLPGQEYFCFRRVYSTLPGIILFLAGSGSVLGGFFPYQERKIPRNPETPEIFLPRKSLISDILDSILGQEIFLTFF